MNKSSFFQCTFLLLFAALLFPSCSLLFGNNEKPEQQKIPIDSLALSLKTVTVPVGGMEYVSLTIRPQGSQKNAEVRWTYDEAIIICTADNYGAVITGKKNGNTSLKVTSGGITATCIVTVSGVDESYEEAPYIYSNYAILEMRPGISEKVHVSLYGGTAGDVDGFLWTVDNSSSVSISPTGQYCMLTAKEEGSAKITVSHPKSAYSYSMYVYVFNDSATATYITTTQNIVTINRTDGDTGISVDLKNPVSADYQMRFSWQLVSDTDEPCVSIAANRQNAVLTPIKSGNTIVRVSHPESGYSLDILVRVITIVENIYIQPSETLITLSGSESKTITADLQGLSGGKGYSPDEFSWEVTSASDTSSDECVDYFAYGNQITLSGKKNGAAKVIVRHELSAYPREIMVLIRDQVTDAIDASKYITTTQNYIRTKDVLIRVKGKSYHV
jgi:hypothetical protein